MTYALNSSVTDWSVDYAGTIKRRDNRLMLSLLRLESWPNLAVMHADFVEGVKLICSLLEKRPMVGFLIAPRLKLPADKTLELLNVLQSKGHVVPLGGDLLSEHTTAKESTAFSPTIVSQQTQLPVDNNGDVLNQLWRVLNTDISLRKSTNIGGDTTEGSEKAAGDVLGQLWRVLNTDIVKRSDAKKQSDVSSVAFSVAVTSVDQEKFDGVSSGVMGQLWAVLNTDIAFKRQEEAAERNHAVEDKPGEVSDVLRQLWRVLNTDIAYKR